jgi:hypothetical protein
VDEWRGRWVHSGGVAALIGAAGLIGGISLVIVTTSLGVLAGVVMAAVSLPVMLCGIYVMWAGHTGHWLPGRKNRPMEFHQKGLQKDSDTFRFR